MTTKENPPGGNRGAHTTALSANQSSSPSAAQPADSPPGSSLQWVPCLRSYPQDVNSQLERRREAKRRLPRICDRCSARDPIQCRCYDPEPPLTEHQVNSWRDAALHVLGTGRTPILPIEVLQRLYRNGGVDRELAMRVWAQTGGLVA
jgi:hypothetical protein